MRLERVWEEEGSGRRCNPMYRVWGEEGGGRRCNPIGCVRRRWEGKADSVCDTK